MARKQTQTLAQTEADDVRDFALDDLDFGDVGVDDMPDIDLGIFDVLDGEEEQSRYTKPKVYGMKKSHIMYDNAEKLARDLRLDFGERADVFVSGNFIFGDFIEAYFTEHRVRADVMTISTLSLSQNNVDSLQILMDGGYVGRLNLIVSAYFYGNERGALIPYIYRCLDKDDRFQLAVAGIHTKTCQFHTLGGRKILIHGSANLRSSGNIEQFTVEENPELYDFYDENFTKILDTYATVRKPIRHTRLWEEFTKEKSNNLKNY